MIITPDFVYVHMPKTGGTFVTRVLDTLYADRKLPRPLHRLRKAAGRRIPGIPPYVPPVRNVDKHGFGHQIPPEAAHLPILGCVRNPMDRYVSQYRFRWWRANPGFFPGLAEHPEFPDLSFSSFVELADRRFTGMYNRRIAPHLGWHTVQFVNWYCRDPERLVRDDDLDAEGIRADLLPVTFLRTGELNRGLHDFLVEIGFPEDRVAFVLEWERILPEGGGRPRGDRWQRYYTPALERRVRERERLLFELFPSFLP